MKWKRKRGRNEWKSAEMTEELRRKGGDDEDEGTKEVEGMGVD